MNKGGGRPSSVDYRTFSRSTDVFYDTHTQKQKRGDRSCSNRRAGKTNDAVKCIFRATLIGRIGEEKYFYCVLCKTVGIVFCVTYL